MSSVNLPINRKFTSMHENVQQMGLGENIYKIQTRRQQSMVRTETKQMKNSNVTQNFQHLNILHFHKNLIQCQIPTEKLR